MKQIHKKMNRIKDVLEKEGVKQSWLAEKLGKSYVVNNDYTQKRNQLRQDVLFKIAELLHVKSR